MLLRWLRDPGGLDRNQIIPAVFNGIVSPASGERTAAAAAAATPAERDRRHSPNPSAGEKDALETRPRQAEAPDGREGGDGGGYAGEERGSGCGQPLQVCVQGCVVFLDVPCAARGCSFVCGMLSHDVFFA